MLVTTWLSNKACHLQPIGLKTLVVIHSESWQTVTLVPSFCTLPSHAEVAVLFYLNLSRLDLLLCINFN